MRTRYHPNRAEVARANNFLAPPQWRQRERQLMLNCENSAVALGRDLAAFAAIQGSCDGTAQLGPIGLRDDLEIVARLRRRRP